MNAAFKTAYMESFAPKIYKNDDEEEWMSKNDINCFAMRASLHEITKQAAKQINEVPESTVTTEYKALEFASPAKWLILLLGCESDLTEFEKSWNDHGGCPPWLLGTNLIVIYFIGVNEHLS